VGLVAISLIVLVWFGPTKFLQVLIDLSESYGPWEKGALAFTAVTLCITLCMPFWPPLMIVTGFVINNLLTAFLINFGAYLLAAVVSFYISLRFQET